jgi:hypothetical protein
MEIKVEAIRFGIFVVISHRHGAPHAAVQAVNSLM